MPEVKRQIKLITEQRVIGNPADEMPLRSWNIELHLIGANGEEIPANCFEKVVYTLHETFNDRQIQTFKRPPFKISEEGWGEFDMRIAFHTSDKSGDQSIAHDLNFQNERYETKHTVTFKNPKPPLLAILKESGTIPGEANGVRSKDESAKKKKRPEKGMDMEKLAENLQKMNEDDLIQVVQMIHDNKTSDSWTKNDVEQGEFQVDLYTLPDSLLRQLWDYTAEKLNR